MVGVGSGVQQQPDPGGVARADRRGQRGGGGDVRRVRQQQPQALVVALERRQVQHVVIGPGAVLQQQPGDGRVGRARDRAQQRRPLAALPVRPGGGIGARGQQQPRDLGQPAGPGRVQPVPPRGARHMQGGPPGPDIRPGGQPRIAGQHLADPGGIAQDHRGAEVVAVQPLVMG